MATIWLDLFQLNILVNLKATNLKATLKNKLFFINQFKGRYKKVDLKNLAFYLQKLL